MYCEEFFYNEIHSELLWSTEGEFWGCPWDATSVLLLHIRCHWPFDLRSVSPLCFVLVCIYSIDDMLERLYLSTGLGSSWRSPRKAEGDGWREGLGLCGAPAMTQDAWLGVHNRKYVTQQLSAKSKKSLFFKYIITKNRREKYFIFKTVILCK